MIHIIGGAKTGYNLYVYILSLGLPVELFYFPNDYSEKKKKGKEFYKYWKGVSTFKQEDILFITSETAFVNLSQEDRIWFETHYFLRDKQNLKQIAQYIKTFSINEIDLNSLKFPLAIKPKESSAGKVPFKFKKIKNSLELQSVENILDHCILQPYLSDEHYYQIAVAGYFDGEPSSLIVVEQKNHYPKGISAYVVDQTQQHQYLVLDICKYLNQLNFKGFIEFEFKKNKKTNQLYLMDINPRTWGWFYYYLSGITNFKEVINEGKFISLQIRKSWVNLPRLVAANIKGKYVNPSIVDFFKQGICYEPYF